MLSVVMLNVVMLSVVVLRVVAPSKHASLFEAKSKYGNKTFYDTFVSLLPATRVTRLGVISQFGLLFKGPGNFWGEIWFVVGILRV
jgi:hypothetical protein